jgi:predicted nucleotidyltransferase
VCWLVGAIRTKGDGHRAAKRASCVLGGALNPCTGEELEGGVYGWLRSCRCFMCGWNGWRSCFIGKEQPDVKRAAEQEEHDDAGEKTFEEAGRSTAALGYAWYHKSEVQKSMKGNDKLMYQALLQAIVEEASRQEEIIGILLAGSVARGDALPGADLDLRFILTPGAKREFQRGLREGVLVEQEYTDVALAQSKLEANPMEVYAYLDGRFLFDPQGVLAELKTLAQRRFETYQIPEPEREKIATWLEAARFKIRVADREGNLLKAAFVTGTVSWQIIEGLWAANNRPLPPNGSIWPHLKDLSQGPADVEAKLKLFFCRETQQRVRIALELLDWILSSLEREGEQLWPRS